MKTPFVLRQCTLKVQSWDLGERYYKIPRVAVVWCQMGEELKKVRINWSDYCCYRDVVHVTEF